MGIISKIKNLLITVVAVLIVVTQATAAMGEDTLGTAAPDPGLGRDDGSSQTVNSSTSPAAGQSTGEKVNVDKIKQKYWAKGDKASLRVVQNRLFIKDKKLEFSLGYLTSDGDPFIDTKGLSFLLGFHLSEFFSLNALYFEYFSELNDAHTVLRQSSLAGANSNNPESYWGGEVSVSPLYGKNSFLGKAIFYLDTHLLMGAGSTQIETARPTSEESTLKMKSQSVFTYHLGIGTQLFMNRWLSARLDYRKMWYREDLYEQYRSATLNTKNSSRTLSVDIITLGLSALIGF